MRPIRDIWGELVERRLWPVAAALVIALVAVPVLLAKSPEAPDATSAPSAAVVAAAATADLEAPAGPVVQEAAGDGPSSRLRGRAKNPFRQQFATPDADSGSGADGVIIGTTTDGSGGTDSTGGAGDGGTGEGTGTPSEPTYTYATIDVRFGKAASTLREIHDVPRLTPLPNAANPVAIFLGMREDHETAVFMVPAGVRVQGDGRCVPSRKLCEAIELRQDDVVLLDVTAENGTITQYELALVLVEIHETTDKSIAAEAYARQARAGRRILRRHASTSAVASVLRYSKRTGVLVAQPGAFLERTGRSSRTRRGGPRASAGASGSAAPVLQ